MTQIRFLFLTALVLTLSGCAFGRHVDYSAVGPTLHVASDKEVAVAVYDARPYVLSGGKNPQFVGVRRGGYYNPFNVNTVSGKPLAADLQQSIMTALAKSDIRTVAQEYRSPPRSDNEGQRLLVLRVKEWKTDTYSRTRFHYDIEASVFDSTGRVLGTHGAQNSSAISNYYDSARFALTQVLGTSEISDALSGVPVTAVPMAAPLPTSTAPLGPRQGSPAYDKCMARVLQIQDETLRMQAMPTCDAAL
jgi:hypothetical protein